MQGYVLEQLHPTGWRRNGELYWRYGDAEREAARVLREHEARGVRILAVRVNSDAIYERLAEVEVAA
jgi:hypothetical protein